MRAFLVLLRFELRRLRFVFPAALLAGTVFAAVLSAASLFRPGRFPVEDLGSIFAIGLPLLFAFALALSLGTGLLARDLRYQRFAFFLARPVAVPSLFLSRLVAAFFVTAGSAVLCLLPFVLLPGIYLFAPGGPIEPGVLPGALLAIGLIALLVYLAAAIVSLSATARTAWLILELVTLATAVLLVLRIHAVGLRWLFTTNWYLLFGLALAVLLALGLGLTLARGRGDLPRAHRVQALMLLPALLLPAAVALPLSSWALSPAPHSLDNDSSEVRARRLPGEWFEVNGPTRDGSMSASFLIDGTTGEWIQMGVSVPAAEILSGDYQTGPDGSALFWLLDPTAGVRRLARIARGPDGAIQRHITTVVSRLGSHIYDWDLSPDGATFALLLRKPFSDRGTVEIHETTGGRPLSLGSGQLWLEAVALDEGRVRTVGYDPAGHLCLAEWKLESTSEKGEPAILACREDLDRDVIFRAAFVRHAHGLRIWLQLLSTWEGLTEEQGRQRKKRFDTYRPAWKLLDGETLASLDLLAPPSWLHGGEEYEEVVRVGNDELVASWWSRSEREVEGALGLFDSRLQPLGYWAFPEESEPGYGPHVRVVSTRAENELVVAVASGREGIEGHGPWRHLIVDFTSGTSRPAPGYENLTPASNWTYSLRGVPLYRNEQGRLVIVDAATGESRPVR
ncbi:MAG: hypothetical protein QM311_08950 [Acidobacteriota bacterium]|jgi:hypothetical protein|nr:hypothetical protein [Acidobacteriota bacterium]